jgi:hypothetical protein
LDTKTPDYSVHFRPEHVLIIIVISDIEATAIRRVEKKPDLPEAPRSSQAILRKPQLAPLVFGPLN